MHKLTPEEKILAEAMGIVFDEEGYMKSSRKCEGCDAELWVLIKTKPFRWESDVQIISHTYHCKKCGEHWTEYDSD